MNGSNLKITVYALCYNEALMLPFFTRHYTSLADRIVIYDNESSDSSVEMALMLGATEIRTLRTNHQIRDDITMALKNSHWKECRALDCDYVFVVDMDEFLYHPSLLTYLRKSKETGVPLIVPEGYQMIGEALPAPDRPITEQSTNGAYSVDFSKPVIFDPHAIDEMNFSPGAHRALPKGRLDIDLSGCVKLLHYHHLTPTWSAEQNKWRGERLSEINLERGWGKEYRFDLQKTSLAYRKLKRNAVDVFACQESDSATPERVKDRKSRNDGRVVA